MAAQRGAFYLAILMAILVYTSMALPSSSSAANVQKQGKCWGTVNAKDGLRVRSCASTSCKQVASLTNGEIVEIFQTRQGEDIHGNTTWWSVRIPNDFGWVAGYYLKDIVCS